ncbi:hypothetical protein DesyoDRAFT_2904 [Desulfosporosinus youngiae DSM 17734]|uniref:Uncharacterized protein n=1 Tax=Desulfosporosinus youngiae DSM 17734 TaxID=768710 RepID=H5Y4C4_9FIRM|nr:hypothetical protein DesyoDRAFT_2904 [Desulfosporosinus youngiae DSM 17734]
MHTPSLAILMGFYGLIVSEYYALYAYQTPGNADLLRLPVILVAILSCEHPLLILPFRKSS